MQTPQMGQDIEYVYPAGPVLDSAPGPFDFMGVTASVFPLKADFYRLRTFCDQYLNLAPEIVEFRPFLPYVFLTALHYGKLSAEVARVGWVSQNEVLFSIPLECYKRQGGKLVFQDWNFVAPFIFVDSDGSATTGREVYGWPKVLCELDRPSNPWTSNPLGPRCVMSLRTKLFSKLYAAKPLESRTLLEIEQMPPPTLSTVPGDFFNPLNPLVGVPNAIGGAWTAGSSAAAVLWRLWRPGYGSSGDSPLRQLLARLPKMLAERPSANLVNLKQFRDVAEQDRACYQALVFAPLRVMDYHAGGLLGDMALLGGDPTGGYRIKLHRYNAMPIVDVLGLVAEEAPTSQGCAPVDVLKPIFPSWLKMDLRYELGHRICWRNRTTTWSVEGSLRKGPEELPSYNTALGTAERSLEGPFAFRNNVLRVFPLKANWHTLKDYADRFLNQLADTFYFEPVNFIKAPVGEAGFVFLIVMNYGETSSAANDLGWWANHEVSFAVPLWYREGSPGDGRDDGKEKKRLVFAWPYSFSDNSVAVTTAREVSGMSMVRGRAQFASHPWLSRQPPEANRCLLAMETDVFPALNVGQELESRTFLEIEEELPQARVFKPEPLEGCIAKFLHSCYGPEAVAHAIQTVLTEVIPHLADDPEKVGPWRTWVSSVVLKQFRDASQPTRPCYQELVHSRIALRPSRQPSGTRPAVLEPTFYRSEARGPFQVKLYRYRSLPIVETLGLIGPEQHDPVSGRALYELEAVAPFWLRTDMLYERGSKISWRHDDGGVREHLEAALRRAFEAG